MIDQEQNSTKDKEVINDEDEFDRKLELIKQVIAKHQVLMENLKNS